MLVKFIRSVTPYLAGETASFPTKEAQMLIDSGRAVKWPAEQQAASTEKPKAHEAVINETARDLPPAVTKPVRGRRGKRR